MKRDGFARNAAKRERLTFGRGRRIDISRRGGALRLLDHLAAKLLLNTVSTGTMAKLGRVSGNWMSHVDCTNKKLLDRGTRLVAELAKRDYRTACAAIFEALDELAKHTGKGEKPSPVQLALKKLGRRD